MDSKRERPPRPASRYSATVMTTGHSEYDDQARSPYSVQAPSVQVEVPEIQL